MRARLNVSALRQRLCASPCVVYFTKRDGSERRMVTSPGPEGCQSFTLKDGAPALRLFDTEAGAYRTVNLATVYRLRQLRATRHAAVRPSRPASAPARPSAADVEAWADDFAVSFAGRAR